MAGTIVSSYILCRRALLASAIDLLPGLDGDADLLAVLGLETNARRLAILGRDRDLGNVHRRFDPLQATLRVGLARLAVAGRNVDAGDDHLAILREGLRDITGLALVLAGQDDNAVTLLDLRGRHHST